MARKLASLSVICCCVVAFALPSVADGRSALTPHRFAPGPDGDLVQLVNPVDGVRYSVWTYGNGSETDIAFSKLDKSSGLWTEPTFFGEDDGEDQIQPTLAIDANGSVYAAWAERSTGHVRISALRAGSDFWTEPQIVSSRGVMAKAPTLEVVDQSLVLAYSAGERTKMRIMPLIQPLSRSFEKLTDGPDPVLGTFPPNNEEEQDDDDQDAFDLPEGGFDIDGTGISDGNKEG